MPAIIGESLSDSSPLRISARERCSGLYILGLPRTGKGWLIANLILQDIENGHGVFFIDPHYEAIQEIVHRTQKSYLLFHIEDRKYSFGINPLECNNVDDLKARSDTFAKVKGFFDKLWKETFEGKPWLQLILQNTIHAFIENQGYTLAEFPLFFRDPAFRQYIAGNMRYNRAVKEYWLETFTAKSKHSQEEQLEAAQTRAETLIGHPYVRDIIGQTKTTIDFETIMKERKIVFVNLPTSLSYEYRKIIGTMLISELRAAAQKRPPTNQSPFCIFIDEFQTFASFEDIPVLITEAPKRGIATTIAHQERAGQLADNPQLLGATAAIANKVLFKVTAKDAQELAPEFADAPPTVMRYFDQYTISQEPVSYLLRGHANPDIRRFVNEHIRPISYGMENIGAEIEDRRYIRMGYTAQAELHRLNSQIEGVGRESHDVEYMRWELYEAQDYLGSADRQLTKMHDLQYKLVQMRVSMRELNDFLVAIMEGRIASRQEAYSEFLIRRSRGIGAIPEQCRAAVELWIAIGFGDSDAPRVVPYCLARDHNLFPGEVAAVEKDAEARYKQKQLEFVKEQQGRALVSIQDAQREIRNVKQRRDMDRYYSEEKYKREMAYLEKTIESSTKEYADTEKLASSFDSRVAWKKDTIAPPGDLPARPLTVKEQYNVAKACEKEMEKAGCKHIIRVLCSFSGFCTLLAEPENHILVRSGQMVAKEVNLRKVLGVHR